MSSLYVQRINTVFDYLRAHLADELSLDSVARIAHFSPFHFHRIFSAMTGETLNDCVNRLRLERAAALLKAQPDMSITQAALDSGFVRLETFSRAFRKQYGITARSWDRITPLKDRKNHQVFSEFPFYTDDVLETADEQGEFIVEVKSMPTCRQAFIRVINSYQPNRILDAYERLVEWYRTVIGDPLGTVLFGMSQDDPEVTPLELCRYDICLALPGDFEISVETAAGGDEDISFRQFPACTLAYVHCIGDIYVVDRAWQYLYRRWLPRSRYMPDNLPAMEVYRRQPAEIGWLMYDLDCAIPIIRP